MVALRTRHQLGLRYWTRCSIFCTQGASYLNSKVCNGHSLADRKIKPNVLLFGVKGAYLGVMTPRQIVPTSGHINLAGHISNVPQGLNVVARNLRDLLVLLPPADGAVADPVPH